MLRIPFVRRTSFISGSSKLSIHSSYASDNSSVMISSSLRINTEILRRQCCFHYCGPQKLNPCKRILIPCTHQLDHVVCKRSFSTTTINNSLSERLAKYYVKRDEMRLMRKEFYERYSAAAFVKAMPEKLQPYLQLARADKPIGTWLLYLPCTFGICMATPAGSFPSLYYLGLFGVGAFLMRGAGCVINDLWDRDFDKHVKRTKDRPLASGRLSPKQAIGLLAVQLSLSLGILLSLNTTCIMIGFCSMIPVILYPLAKRVTNYPQAVLGVTFNIGAIMGYAAVANDIYWWSILPLYAGCFTWTLYYDTVYAMQDVEDDELLGIKSTALLLNKKYGNLSSMPYAERLEGMMKEKQRIEIVLSGLYILTLMSWSTAIIMHELPFPAYLAIFLLLARSLNPNYNMRDVSSCHQRFVENKNHGLIFLIGIILAVYINHPNRDRRKKTKLQ